MKKDALRLVHHGAGVGSYKRVHFRAPGQLEIRMGTHGGNLLIGP